MKKSELIEKIKKIWKEIELKEKQRHKEMEKSFDKFSIKDLKEILLDEEIELSFY